MTSIKMPVFEQNMRIVGYSDQGGRSDGVQIMVERGFAYIGHIFSKGFTIVDVRPGKSAPDCFQGRATGHLELTSPKPRGSALSGECARYVRSARIFRRTSVLPRLHQREYPTRNANARLDCGFDGLRYIEARKSSSDRTFARRGRRGSPGLVHRRTLGIHVGPIGRVH